MSVSRKSSVSSSRYSKRKKKVIDKTPKDDFMDRFHPPDKKICDIIATNTAEKVDPLYVFRPQSSMEYLDYNISQTEAKMDCGPTKIHLSTIRAEYERYPEDFVFPEVERKKKKRPQKGRGPVWLYLDEIFKKRIDREQALNLKLLEERLARKALLKKHEMKHMVSNIIDNALPNWFQELSASQKKHVDRLKEAIAKDLRLQAICNVQECLARLGLVLRPNSKNVERALKKCGKDPVKFLLLIYKYSKSTEVDYSTNDRLTLSAIVHLMTPTLLREMHVRIPSPPPIEIPPTRVIPCAKKRVKYESPYLEPYTFEPEPKKHTGVYKNRHIQYPESPYFFYLEDFRLEMEAVNKDDEQVNTWTRRKSRLVQLREKANEYNPADPVERELKEERDRAQALYEAMFADRKVPKLIRASLYDKLTSEKRHTPENLRGPTSASPEITVPTVAPEKPSTFLTLISAKSEEEEEFGKEDLLGGPNVKTDDDRTKTTLITVHTPIKEIGDNVSKDEPVCAKPESDKDKNKKDLSPYERYPMHPFALPVYGGITYDRDGNLVPIIAGLKRPDLLCICVNKDVSKEKSEEKLLTLRKHKKKNVCECRKKLEREKEFEEKKRQQKELCTCEICSCKNKIPTTPPRVPSIPAFVPPSNTYDKHEEKTIIKIKEPPPFHCHCKDFVNKILEHKKYVEECERECKRKAKLVITGYTKDGKPIVANTKLQPKCKCLEKYQKKIEEFEKKEKVERAQKALKSANRTFVIQGVKPGPDGKPIFMLSGISSERKVCIKCEEIKQAELREEKRIAEMPVFPQGRIQYHISGVQKTPMGNVYIISGAQSPEPCDCMKLYDNFVKRHSKCLHLYERFLEKIKTDTKEYLEDIKKPRGEIGSSKNVTKLTSKSNVGTKKAPPLKMPVEKKKSPTKLTKSKGKKSSPKVPSKDLTLKSTSTAFTVKAPTRITSKSTVQTSLDPGLLASLFPSLPSAFLSFAPPKPPPPFVFPPPATPIIPVAVSSNTELFPATKDTKEKDSKSKPGYTLLAKSSSPLFLLSPPGKSIPAAMTSNIELFAATKEKDSSSSSSSEDVSTSTVSELVESKVDRVKTSEECICVKSSSSEELIVPPVVTPPKKIEEKVKGVGENTRYILLKRIPCERKKQINIIKKVLKGLAKDGYPVAALKGAYRLPHFRIWMAMRCRNFWTMEDRVDMAKYSIRFWEELSKCKAVIRTERLNISYSKARKFTWAQSKYVKTLTDSLKDRQYRRIKHALILDGRTFFPSMFDCELPTNSFREVYNAYIPYKEESVFPRFPWAQFEYRNYSMMREKNARRRFNLF